MSLVTCGKHSFSRSENKKSSHRNRELARKNRILRMLVLVIRGIDPLHEQVIGSWEGTGSSTRKRTVTAFVFVFPAVVAPR